MTKEELKDLLKKYKTGEIGENDLVTKLSYPPTKSLGFANIDMHRELRKGFPEVIYCEGKTPEHVAEIAAEISGGGQLLLATRATNHHFDAVKRKLKNCIYHEISRTITLDTYPEPVKEGTVLVLTAGTTDIAVAEEAKITLRTLGSKVNTVYDLGIAGIHRLFERIRDIHEASVIIVAAGMEGALPGIVAGLIDVPVIAIPTSTGYGTSFGGIAALLTMLNSCSNGVTVVNIDNGFGAAFAAHLINK